MKKKPYYFGEASEPFWRRVNRLDDPDKSSLYTAGVLLQEAESRVLQWLEAAEKRQRRARLRKKRS